MERSKEYYRLISMQPVVVKGDYVSKRVWLNGKELTPDHSRKIFNHTAAGFDWGDPGGGSSQLALAVLLELTGNKKISMILHHVFKNEFFASLPKSDFESVIDIGEWFYQNIHKSRMMPDI